jgi:glyoxylase-like metal-dependent hydrolase (beta-lactamase superfamily II)
VYISKLAHAAYLHQTFDDGDVITLGALLLKALNTPGHSPESISILLENEEGKPYAIFTGDTLFVGDVGRPDLREGDSSQTAKEYLAAQLFASLHTKLLVLPDAVKVYPSHGPGSLCGKNLGPELESTIGKEKCYASDTGSTHIYSKFAHRSAARP